MEIDARRLEEIKQQAVDEEHLRLLAIAHYISGVMTILFSCMFIFHFVFLAFAASNPDAFGGKEREGAQVLSIFLVIFGMVILLGVSFGIAQIISGRFIKQRRRRLFSFIIAMPNLIFIPYGTLLGVATLIVLERKSVKALYDDRASEGRNA